MGQYKNNTVAWTKSVSQMTYDIITLFTLTTLLDLTVYDPYDYVWGFIKDYILLYVFLT